MWLFKFGELIRFIDNIPDFFLFNSISWELHHFSIVVIALFRVLRSYESDVISECKYLAFCC